MNRIIATLGFIIASYVVEAQDLHFTQYAFSPLHVNPANAGLFKGSYRVGGIFRDQAFAISSAGAYKTLNFYIDVTLPWKVRKNDWVGLGINVIQDRSGDIGWGAGGFIGQLAYHLSINPKTTLSLGAQYGSSSFNVKSPQKANTESLIRGIQGAVAFNNGAKYTDITIGTDLSTAIGSAKHDLSVGVNAARINQPTATNLSTGAGQKLGTLITGYAGLNYHLNQKLDLRNHIWVRSLKSFNEIIPQCVVSYLANVEKKIRLNAGLGYRFGDAVQLMFGADIDNLAFQIGIDQTLSGLRDAQSPTGFGAVEFAAKYTGIIVKKPDPKPKVFCPRF
ncbi:MAG: PorP/SprF family type IX secretion system membrane protein [Saprospiraceae bacterium]|nr:PorP/SprF family type IX secretion system membrane protein [Saprospiraceae bacterium]